MMGYIFISNYASKKEKCKENNVLKIFFSCRMDTDVIKLIESKHEVTLLGNNLNEFCVKFYGPRGKLTSTQNNLLSSL
jgi:hypothetical protein